MPLDMTMRHDVWRQTWSFVSHPGDLSKILFLYMSYQYFCHLRSIAAHRDHFVWRLSVCTVVTLSLQSHIKLCFTVDTCIPLNTAILVWGIVLFDISVILKWIFIAIIVFDRDSIWLNLFVTGAIPGRWEGFPEICENPGFPDEDLCHADQRVFRLHLWLRESGVSAANTASQVT